MKQRKWAWAGLVAGAIWAAGAEAQASPGVEGTRNLSMSGARASAYGSNAVLTNPSNMPFSPTFTIEPMYQFNLRSRTHGLAAVVMDSLNNARISLGLGYVFLRGTPRVQFNNLDGDPQDFELETFGHEVMLGLGIVPVLKWLSLGVKPKYQYWSLRYRDEDGVARDAHDKLNAFGLDVSATVNLAGWASLSVTGDNLVGNHPAPYTDERSIDLENVAIGTDPIDHETLGELSPYPLQVTHSLAVFPLRRQMFSLNFDGTYDFSTYRFEKHTRLTYGGSAEFVVGPVPLRFGTMWDSRGKGGKDDRIFVSGGVGYVKPAKAGGVGVDIGVGFAQQVNNSRRDTILGLNLGIRIHPDI